VPFRYSVFDLKIRSTSAIPGLRPVEDHNSAPDLEVFIGAFPDANEWLGSSLAARLIYVSEITDDGGEPALKVWELGSGALLHITYLDGTQFWFDRSADRLWMTWDENSSVENATLYLLGPILALVLRYRGIVCLHASAVVFDNRAVAFVGAEEAGKSTTAAAFTRRGCAILSDDVLPLREQEGVFVALPGSPHLRLWPDSAEMLFGPGNSLPQLLPEWDKKRLSAGDYQSKFHEHACPLGAVYLLNDRSTDMGIPRIDAVDNQSALMSLVRNSYASQLINDRMRAKEFEFLGRLVSRVPVRRLSPHSDCGRIEELCDLVSFDSANLNTPLDLLRN
jgi:hypothetical protein